METEIKLVARPGEALEPASVLAAAAGFARVEGAPTTRRLDASYHDTADGRLRAARWTLRCRAEGERFVGTVKGPGGLVAGLESRTEVELELPRRAEPGEPLPERLAGALAGAGLSIDRWPPRSYRSVVDRTSAVLELAGGTRAELAIDRGEVRAGGRASPVRELEIELISGAAEEVARAALALAGALDVRPGTRTKAGRGLLLLGLLAPPHLPEPGGGPAVSWHALAELEERRLEGDARWSEEHARLCGELGISVAPDAAGWTAALWAAFARALGLAATEAATETAQ